MKNNRLYNLDSFIGKTYDISNNTGLQQRGIADLIEDDLTNYIIDEYNGLPARSRRSIEDVGLSNYSVLVDIKTKWIGDETEFHMPNLVSVDRIRKHYQYDNNYIEYVFVDYSVNNNTVTINDIEYFKLEEIGWGNLHIQNLGKGQVQIKDANKDIEKFDSNREEWLKLLKDNTLKFHDKQIQKIQKERLLWESM